MNARLHPARQERKTPYWGDFRCTSCGHLVSALPQLSGVRNRNHCPYCLASRHVDLWQPGDRLSACKAPMQPVGLSIKRVQKKYASLNAGELMLIHRCVECGKLSLNRIAADDDPQALLEVFAASQRPAGRALVADPQITLLTAADLALVRRRLLGCN